MPHNPVNTEKFKTFNELLLVDKGGLIIFEPIVGAHGNIAEFDFISLYLSIMTKCNVSGETVNCSCCPDSQNFVKELAVVSFGNLGHANSKFGMIDSHIVVCAIDREVLHLAHGIAESKGFTCLHGIVGVLWVQQSGAAKLEYAKLKEPIEQATVRDISFEGVYKWRHCCHLYRMS